MEMLPFKARVTSDGTPAVRGSDLSDGELCEALTAGESWAAEAVYDRVEDVVDGVLFRLLGPGDVDRDDLTQQAIESVITTIVSGRFARGCSLRSWATLITQHLAIDTMRARTRERTLFDRNVPYQALELVASNTQTPERAAETRRRIERLLGALSAVNQQRAEAVVLHDVLEHDLAEIARLTGITVAAAQSRLVRGRREILKWILTQEGKND
jgi:RNA polymerase sigma-70 factor (ECF subfamily)